MKNFCDFVFLRNTVLRTATIWEHGLATHFAERQFGGFDFVGVLDGVVERHVRAEIVADRLT